MDKHLKLAFICKKTKRLIDVVPYPVAGGLTPNHGQDFYIVITDISGNIGDDWSLLIDSQLERLRAEFPDTKSTYLDEDGNECESVVYGKYSEQGFCSEPWAEVMNG